MISNTPNTPRRTQGTYATKETEGISGIAEESTEERDVSRMRRERMDGSSQEDASDNKVDETSKLCWETAKSLRRYEWRALQRPELDPLRRRGIGGGTVEGDDASEGRHDGRENGGIQKRDDVENLKHLRARDW